jgi:drug/metabolite transporter (DMT)-like permease
VHLRNYISKDELKGHIAMLLFSIFVSVSYVIGLLVANDIEPGAITAARFLIGACVMGSLIIISGKYSKTDFKSPWRFFIVGSSIVVYFVLMFEALKTSSSLSLSAVFTLTPLIALVLEFFLKKKINFRTVLGIALGALGALWIIFDGSLHNLYQLKIGYGEIIFFWGCVGHALYAILIPLTNRGEDAASQSFGTLAAGFILLLTFFWRDIFETNWLELTLLVWFTILYLATVATALTFFLIQFAAKKINASNVMAYTYAVPFWVVLGNIIIGQGTPEPKLILGGVIIAFALFLLISDNRTST